MRWVLLSRKITAVKQLKTKRWNIGATCSYLKVVIIQDESNELA